MSKLRCAFFGTPEFASIILEALIALENLEIPVVVTQTDKPAGRGQKLQFSAVKKLALEHSIETIQPEKIKKQLDSFLNDMKSFGALDLAVVVAYGQILPQAVLDLPKYGCMNVHASLLPRWRGAAPLQHSILSGDLETGVCLMKMEAGLDTGPVYVQEKVKIDSKETLSSLHDKLAHLGAELVKNHVMDIAVGKIPAVPQAEQTVTYAKKINSSDATINWNKPAVEIDRLVRAFNPFPGAFTLVDGNRLKIFDLDLVEARPNTITNIPGTVIFMDQNNLEIECDRQTVVSIKELQLAGRKRMSVDQFLRGIEIQIGDQLG